MRPAKSFTLLPPGSERTQSGRAGLRSKVHNAPGTGAHRAAPQSRRVSRQRATGGQNFVRKNQKRAAPSRRARGGRRLGASQPWPRAGPTSSGPAPAARNRAGRSSGRSRSNNRRPPWRSARARAAPAPTRRRARAGEYKAGGAWRDSRCASRRRNRLFQFGQRKRGVAQEMHERLQRMQAGVLTPRGRIAGEGTPPTNKNAQLAFASRLGKNLSAGDRTGFSTSTNPARKRYATTELHSGGGVFLRGRAQPRFCPA